MEERTLHPLDYVSVLQRRKWWFIVPLVICLIGGAIASLVWPREYLSETDIGVAAPTLRPELLAGVSSLNPQERARAISQQLLSPAVLERVVREEQINPSAPVAATAQWMRSRVEQTIVVEKPIVGNLSNPTLDRFKLGWIDSSPERAQQIANRLAVVFVEENSKVRTQQAENTSEVLARQVSESQQKLASLEDELRKRKETFMGRLPEQMNSNLSLVNGLRQQLESNATQQRAETDRLNQIESQLDMMRQGIGVMQGSNPSPIAADVSLAHSRVTELQKRLSEARALGYTDQHPEVVIAKEELVKAQSDLAAARKAQRSPNRDELLSTDPFYAAKVNEARFAQQRLNSLRQQAGRIEAQIASFQSRVESAPVVEQQLASLQQQRDLEKANYESLVKKHQESMMAEDLARKQGGERFSVLYPAYSGRQISPDLLKLWAVAIGLGLVLGAVAVVGREFLDRSVHDARALQTEFEIPVLGEIPRIPA